MGHPTSVSCRNFEIVYSGPQNDQLMITFDLGEVPALLPEGAGGLALSPTELCLAGTGDTIVALFGPIGQGVEVAFGPIPSLAIDSLVQRGRLWVCGLTHEDGVVCAAQLPVRGLPEGGEALGSPTSFQDAPDEESLELKAVSNA